MADKKPSTANLGDQNWLIESDREKLRAIYQSETACFSDLVRVSGLNPSVDFRFSDLTGVDFAGSDLRGFNFVGANLSHTRWFKAVWDDTTNLEGALLTGARGHERAIRSTDQIERVLQPFFENTPMAIATVDKGGKILRANSRFISLRGDARGDSENSIFSVVDPQQRKLLAKAIVRAVQGHNDSPPLDALICNGKEQWGQFFVIADDPVRETAHVYVLDVTERRALESQVNQSQRLEMVGQLAGGIAHDFNNALSAIMTANDFLLAAHKPTDPSYQDIMQIKQNATRAATLVRQLLAFSSRQVLRPQVLDLRESLSDLTMLLRRLIGEKVKLDINYGRDLWPVRVDISQFEQVIVNLAVNARDAMPDGGTLTIKLANVTDEDSIRLTSRGILFGNYVRIDVIDTGAGIAAEIADKIFEPFFSTKPLGSGTGLGLSTVYGIVKQSGGFLFFDTKIANGTQFSILLPRHEPSEILSNRSTFRMASWHKAVEAVYVESISVLLVEPNAALRSLNARGLRSKGYQVVEAEDGVEALGEYIAHGNRFDIVVSEVSLADLDGGALYKEIRKRNPDQVFIFSSGYSEDSFERNFPENEVIAFLPKPFTVDQLIVAITNEIGLRVD